MNYKVIISIFISSICSISFANDLLEGNISRASVGHMSAQSNFHSQYLSFSDDGQYVVFQSNASNLIASDTNGLTDIFLYDTNMSTMSRISISSASVEANAGSFDAVISGNGNYIAFASNATNLVSGDTNNATDVFVRDISGGTTTRVSLGVSSLQANGSSYKVSISDDGRYVGFLSKATNLVGSADTNAADDFFVHDRNTTTTTRVSISTASAEGDDDVHEGRISGNGNYFVFSSDATNLVTGDDNDCGDIFVRSLSSNTTTLVSSDSSSTIGNRTSSKPDVSDDGTLITFTSRASNLVTGDTNGYADVFLKNTSTGVVEKISVDTEENQVIFPSTNSRISDDGRFVVFQSLSPYLGSGDTNASADSFIRDRDVGITKIFSTTNAPVLGNLKTYWPNISGDGETVGFHSFASNLVTGDTNEAWDVFYKENKLPTSQVVNISKEVQLTESGGTQNGFKVERFGSTASPLTVTYTASGSATEGTDYTALSGTVTIPMSSSSAFVPIAVTDDTIVEIDETIILTVTADSAYIIGDGSATNTIPNVDKFEITVAATDNVLTENGQNSATFDIIRTGGTLGDISVNLSLIGTATSGVDYTGISTVAMILDGEDRVEVTAVGIQDSLYEGDESVTVKILTSMEYDVGTADEDTATLKDDDQYILSVIASDAVADEDNSSDKAEFTVTRTGDTTAALSFKYALKGAAVNGTDYTTLSGDGMIAAGNSSLTLEIAATADSTDEGVEDVIIELLEGETYTLGTVSTAAAIIKETTIAPIVSVVATDDEANEAGSDTAVFTVSRTGATSSALVVNIKLGGTAIPGTDYTPSQTTVTIPMGQASATFTVTGSADVLVEETETVELFINSGTGYIVDPINYKDIARITDDDMALAEVFVKQAMVYEDLSGNGEIVFRRKGSLSSALTVNFTVSGSAVSGTDYVSIGSSIAIPAGKSEHAVSLKAISDSLIEGTETITVTISTDVNYTLNENNIVTMSLVDKTYSLFEEILSVYPDAKISSVSASSNFRYVVFSSKASNLVTADTLGWSDIFIVDTNEETISRIDAKNGMEPNGNSYQPVISADGKYVVFTTDASNFIDFDANGSSDIFQYEISSEVITLVSKGSEGPGMGSSMYPSVSENGRFVSFMSNSDNLVSSDTNDKSDIFRWDRSDLSLIRANYTTGFGEFNDHSYRSSVSNDGTIIAFETLAKVSGDTDTKLDIVSVDLVSDSLTRVSEPSSGTENDGHSLSPIVSSGGQVITYQSESSGVLVPDSNDSPDIYSYYLGDMETVLTSSNVSHQRGDKASYDHSIDLAGKFVSFLTTSQNLNSIFNCNTTAIVKDLKTKQVYPISYHTKYTCQKPIASSFLTGNGQYLISTSATSDGIRDILISANPLYK